MMQIIDAATAAERLRAEGMRISPTTLRDGLRQGVFPFGVCVMSERGTPICHVFVRQLEAWIAERSA